MPFTKPTYEMQDPRFDSKPAFGVESDQHKAEVAEYLARKAELQASIGHVASTEVHIPVTSDTQPSAHIPVHTLER